MSETEEKRPMAKEFEGEKLPYPAKQSEMKRQPDSDLSNYKAASRSLLPREIRKACGL